MRTIPPNDRRERFIANAGQTVFPFDYPVYAADDLLVERVRDGVTATLALGTDYAVAGVGADAGGLVTLTAPALDGDVISLASNQVNRRSTHYEEGSALPAASLNAEFNRIWIAIQQLARCQGQALRVGTADVTLVVPPIADAQARAGMLLGFSADGAVSTLYPALSLTLAEDAKTIAEQARNTANAANITSGGAVATAQAAQQAAQAAVVTADAAAALAQATDTRLNSLIATSGNVPPPGEGDAGAVLRAQLDGTYRWDLPTWLDRETGGIINGAVTFNGGAVFNAVTTLNAYLTANAGASVGALTVDGPVTASQSITAAHNITATRAVQAAKGQIGPHYDVFSAFSIQGNAGDTTIAESTLKLKARDVGRPSGILFESADGSSKTTMTYLDGVWNLGGFSLPHGTLWADHRGDAGARRNFYVYDSLSVTNAVLANRMVIDPDGRRAELYVYGVTTGYKFQNDGWRLEWNGTTGILDYMSHASTVLWRCNDQGDTWAKTFNTLSDERLKENIDLLPADRCTEFVQRARPVSYRFRRHPEDLHFGFVAQEIEAGGFGELVSRYENPTALEDEFLADPDADARVLSLDYTQAIPLLTGALKHALERIDALEARLASGAT